MRAAWQHPQHVFGANNGDNKAFPGAVDGRGEQQAARRQAPRCGVDESWYIADMLHHLQCQHHIKLLIRAQCLRRLTQPVVDLHALRRGMQARCCDVARGSVYSHHMGTEPRQCFSQQATAAAHIKNAQPGNCVLLFTS